MSNVVSNTFLVMFAPPGWTPAARFRTFVGSPYARTPSLIRAVRAADSRRHKLAALASLANRLRQGLLQDFEELQRDGYTPASRSKEFAAVAETIFLELYSVLDAVRTTLVEIHAGVRGLNQKRTSALFQRASEKKYGPDFPEPVREALATAYETWFPRLRRFRSAVAHGDIGSCHVDTPTGPVVYMHAGLGNDQQALVIHDLETELNELVSQVTGLVDTIFSFLCSRIDPVEISVPCGLFRGLLYERVVAHGDCLDFDSGKCASRRWFENSPEHQCPMRDRCGAYSR